MIKKHLQIRKDKIGLKNVAVIILRVVMLLLACTMLMSGIVIVKEATEENGSVTTVDSSDYTSSTSSEPIMTPQESQDTTENTSEEITTEEVTTVPEVTEPEEELFLVLTPEEKKILATLIRLECGGSSYECQMAVASVVVNRMKYWDVSLRTVVFAKNQFSPSRLIDRSTGDSKYPPSSKHWQVVEDICKNGPSLPYYVMYFRAGRFHTWCTPYKQIDSTYFSYSPKYM